MTVAKTEYTSLSGMKMDVTPTGKNLAISSETECAFTLPPTPSPLLVIDCKGPEQDTVGSCLQETFVSEDWE